MSSFSKLEPLIPCMFHVWKVYLLWTSPRSPLDCSSRCSLFPVQFELFTLFNLMKVCAVVTHPMYILIEYTQCLVFESSWVSRITLLSSVQYISLFNIKCLHLNHRICGESVSSTGLWVYYLYSYFITRTADDLKAVVRTCLPVCRVQMGRRQKRQGPRVLSWVRATTSSSDSLFPWIFAQVLLIKLNFKECILYMACTQAASTTLLKIQGRCLFPKIVASPCNTQLQVVWICIWNDIDLIELHRYCSWLIWC